MNEMIIFENEQFGTVRVIEQDGEPWFVAADVCRARLNPYRKLREV